MSTSVLDAAARVAEHHSYEMVDGVLLDAQTASLILKVAAKLSPENRKMLDDMSVDKAGRVCWKLVKS